MYRFGEKNLWHVFVIRNLILCPSMEENKATQLYNVIPQVNCLEIVSEYSFRPTEMDVSFITNYDHNFKFL